MKYLALVAAAAAVFAQPAAAQTAAFSTSGETTFLYNPSFTLGYSFSLSKSFNLFGLGIFDGGDDGLLNSYDVGLWDSSGTLITSSNVAAGTAATLMDGYRWDQFSPISLGAGDYRIGALYTNAGGMDPLYFESSSNIVNAIDGVTHGDPMFVRSTTLTNPGNVAELDNGYFGPNLLLGDVGAVPEPATWAMLLLGFGAIGSVLRSGSKLRAPLRRARA